MTGVINNSGNDNHSGAPGFTPEFYGHSGCLGFCAVSILFCPDQPFTRKYVLTGILCIRFGNFKTTLIKLKKIEEEVTNIIFEAYL